MNVHTCALESSSVLEASSSLWMAPPSSPGPHGDVSSVLWMPVGFLSPVCEDKMMPYALGGFLGGAGGKESTCQCRRHKRHGFNPWVMKISLEKEIATHASILAWEIPWTEEPGGL